MLFETDEKFSLRRVKSKKVSIQEEISYRAVWRWEMSQSYEVGRRKKLSIILVRRQEC